MGHQGGTGDNLMSFILKETQKELSKFVTSHLWVTCLILEGVSFNVNQVIKECFAMGFRELQIGLNDEKSQDSLLPVG
jgi:hypothetical protein